MESVIKAVLICSCVIGTVIAVAVIWNALVGNVKCEMRTYTASNENGALDIKIEAGTLRTEYYDGNKIQVEYPVAKCYTAEIYERDGVFHFKNDFRAFFFLFVKPKVPDIVLRLPYGSRYDLRLNLSAGAVNLADGKFQNADVNMSAGSFKCSGICCHSLKLNVSAGSANMQNLTCTGTKIKVSAGSAKLGFTGRREEYSISKSVSAGSCDASAQNGTTDKTIDVNVSAGAVKLNFAV